MLWVNSIFWDKGWNIFMKFLLIEQWKQGVWLTCMLNENVLTKPSRNPWNGKKNMMKLEIDNDQTQLPSLTRQDTRLTFASHQHRKTHSSLWINNFCCLYWVQHNSFLISSSSQNESSKGNSMWQLCDFHFVHRGGLGTGQCRYLVSNIFSYYMTTLRGMG